MRIEALVPGYDPIREVAMLRIQDVGHRRCVGLGTHGEHVQLVELGNPGKEVPGKGAEPAVVEEGMIGQVEAIHILQSHKGT